MCRVCAKFFHPRVRFFAACVFVCVVCVCMGTQRSNKIMRSEDTLAVSQLSAVEMINRLKDFFLSLPPQRLGIQKGEGTEEGYRVSDMSVGQQLCLPLFPG